MRLRALIILAALTTLAAVPAAATPSGGEPVPPDAMAGLDFSGLTDAQKALAVSILNQEGCGCGCGMKLAVCRRDDSTCGRSLGLGTQVIARVREGQGREAIVKNVLAADDEPRVQFALEPGAAPAIGPRGAKVTVLHYLDYQ